MSFLLNTSCQPYTTSIYHYISTTVQHKYFVGYKFHRFVKILILWIVGIIYSHMTSCLFVFVGFVFRSETVKSAKFIALENFSLQYNLSQNYQ